jgi:peptide/nickel transport system substrate-binding protein
MSTRPIRAAAIVVAGALAASGLAACAAGPADDGEETSITFAVSALPVNWDPFNGGTVSFGPTAAVYEPLVDSEGIMTPRLAEEWEISDDGRSIEFTLRDDVEFTDGVHMDADGVADYLTALFASDGFHHKAGVTGEYLVTVEATGEYTLRVDFSGAVVTEEGYGFLGEVPIASPATIGNPAAFEDGPVGTGPYVVDEIVTDASASFVRNPNYWNPDGYDFDKVEFLAFDDEVASLNALKTGQVDAATLSTKLVGEAESAGLSVHAGFGPTSWLEFLDMDGSVVPALADVRVRQAMSMAFDRKAIGDAINLGYGYATSQLFTSEAPEYVEGADDRYPYDPERARELLAEAGYPDGFDLTFKVAASWGADYHPVIQSALGEIGIRVEYEIVPDADTVKLITEIWPDGTQPIAFATLGIITGMAFWIPGYTQDYGPGTRFEELEEVVAEGTPEEKREAATELGPLLLDEVRQIPLGVAPAFYVTQPGIAVETYSIARYPYLQSYTLVE